MLRGIPLGEGRGSFIGGHDSGVGYLVSALVDGGQVRRALQVARWIRFVELANTARLYWRAAWPPEARQRWDDALERYHHIRREIEREAGEDWKAPRAALALRLQERNNRSAQARAALDEAYRLLVAPDRGGPRALAEPAGGEVHLVLFPGSDGWLVFAETRGAVIARRIAKLEVDSWALAAARTGAEVLALVDSMLAGARRVRLFPYASADCIDWAAVAWRGRPLLASVEVEYGLDIGAPGKSGTKARRKATRGPRHRKSDGRSAGRGGGSRGGGGGAPGVGRHAPGRRCSAREATLSALPRARLLHYGGHARAGDGGTRRFRARSS